jgi:ribosome maturation factor RimP
MIDTQLIQLLAEEHLEGTDCFLVSVVVKPDNRIRVFIDSDTFVQIEHCITLSRFIEANLDREKEDFELNVSSAGLDQPYKLVRQYIKNVGRDVSVTLIDKRKLEGKLIKADQEGINLLETKKVKKEIIETSHRFLYTEIKETKEIIKF